MDPRFRLVASTRLQPPSSSQHGDYVAEEHSNVSKLKDLRMDDDQEMSSEAESSESESGSEDSEDESDESSDSSDGSSGSDGASSTSSEDNSSQRPKLEHFSAIHEAQLYVY